MIKSISCSRSLLPLSSTHLHIAHTHKNTLHSLSLNLIYKSLFSFFFIYKTKTKNKQTNKKYEKRNAKTIKVAALEPVRSFSRSRTLATIRKLSSRIIERPSTTFAIYPRKYLLLLLLYYYYYCMVTYSSSILFIFVLFLFYEWWLFILVIYSYSKQSMTSTLFSFL